MAQQTLNIGSTANDGTGDLLRVAMDKVNDNFDEIYASPLFNEDITISGNEIRANRSNDDLVFGPSGTGSIVFPAIKINDNNIEGTRSNDDINIIPSGTGSVVVGSLAMKDNVISTSESNANIELRPNGSGQVLVPELTVDSNINIRDNEIKTTVSDSDLVLSGSGTGSVRIDKADINGGSIDGATIGANSASAGTFTTITANTSATIKDITISDNQITTNASNINLELSGNGTGTVTISGFSFPTTDGSTGQFIKTDGAGNLGFATAGATLNYSDIADATTTLASSSAQVLNTFPMATYRSAKYYISITDTTNNRFEFVEANVIHDGTNAYISSYGSTSNYTGAPTLSDLTVDVSGGDVRLLGRNISDNTCVFKFQRTAIDI